MRKPPTVDPTDPAALSAWLAGTRTLTREIHTFAVDATARKGQRRYAKSHLRDLTRRHFQLLNAHLAALDPASEPRP